VSRLAIMVALTALAAAGCGGKDDPQRAPAYISVSTTSAITTPQPSTITTTSVTLPPEPVAARDGNCPYLDTAFVAQANGQHVSRVRLSADQPHPACFFHRADGSVQLHVQVLAGVEPAVAKRVVDRAAPVASSDPATLPGGWEGGKQPSDAGAVFAVAKGGSAVVVVTNQKQTIKASRIAEQAIAALGL
jgi:UPF0176 protein